MKSYDQYVEELRAWCIVTDLAKEKQGVAIALSLAESDPSGVLDKVFNEIALANLNNGGANTLINYFNRSFLKEELSEVYECYIKFDRYYKETSVKMEDYEKLYNHINQKEMTLPPSVLAFKACVHYFLSIFFFSPNDSSLKTEKCFIFHLKSAFSSRDIQIFMIFPFFSTLSRFERANGSGIIYDVMNWLV